MSQAHMRYRLPADYEIMVENAVVYAVESRTGDILLEDADAKVIYDFCRALLEPGGGGIHFKRGNFPFSDPIYVQSEGGGGVPDYPSYCILTGEGVEHFTSDDQGTFLEFDAGDDGLIIDMHTNDGQWYAASLIKGFIIGGGSGSEMGTGIKIMKAAHPWVDDVRTVFAGAAGTPHVSLENVQDGLFNRLRGTLNLANSIGLYRANIDGVTYLEQGAHNLYTNNKFGCDAHDGQASFQFCVSSGAAVLSQETLLNCESLMSGVANNRRGMLIGNGADTAGIRAMSHIGCNYEGGVFATGNRGLYIDANNTQVRVKIQTCGFAGGSSIAMNNNNERLIVEQCEPQPDNLDLSAGGHVYWYHTDTPANIVAGSNGVYCGAGSNVRDEGRQPITGAVNSVVVNHSINMSLATNLPRFYVTARQTGHGNHWTSAESTTQFTINFDNQPGGSTWNFDWWGYLGDSP